MAGFNLDDIVHWGRQQLSETSPELLVISAGAAVFSAAAVWGLCALSSAQSQKQTRSQQRLRLKRRTVAPKLAPTPEQLLRDVPQQYRDVQRPLLDKLAATVAAREAGQPAASGKHSYRDALEYQARYLEESILKLIVQLDGIDSEQPELRARRKETIKLLQGGHREVDVLAKRIDVLKSKGVEY